jgi:hypothetical protein
MPNDGIRELDCRQVVEKDLGPPKHVTVKTHIYKCPLHNERKGYSLVVYADGWKCFGACNTGGNVVGWTMKYHKLEYREAVMRLGGAVGQPPPAPRRQVVNQKPSAPPGTIWQAAAEEIIRQGEKCLWSDRGIKARNYLYGRGLSEDTIKHHRLGFVPGSYKEWKRTAEMNVPCGILIPWIADKNIWGLKVRRAKGEFKYQQVGGGNIAGALYLADEIQLGLPVLALEGELDALVAWRWGRLFASPVALGSASNSKISSRWWTWLISAPVMLARMDDDEAGRKAVAGLSGMSQRVVGVSVPAPHKDVTEFVVAAGEAAFVEWLVGLIEEHGK